MNRIKEQLLSLENLRSMKAEAYKTYNEALERAQYLESRIFGKLDQIRESVLFLNWKEVKLFIWDGEYYVFCKANVSPEYFETIKHILGYVVVNESPFKYDYSEGEYLVLQPTNQLLKVRLNEE